MRKLLYKEWALARHPTTILFPFLASMVLIPNYPYYVAFFYAGLGIFFICLSGRENRDIHCSALLPVSRADIVHARIGFCILLELAQAALALPFCLLRQALPLPGNAVGMDANLALIALALPMLGLFNLVFFPRYYRAPEKVGTAFLWGSVALTGYMLLAEAAVHVVPFARDVLDTPDTQHLGAKLCVLAVCAVVYAGMNWAAVRVSVRGFEGLDL